MKLTEVLNNIILNEGRKKKRKKKKKVNRHYWDGYWLHQNVIDELMEPSSGGNGNGDGGGGE